MQEDQADQEVPQVRNDQGRNDHRPDIYRREAYEHHRRGQRGNGDLLRISPRWTGHAYWTVLGILTFAVFFLAVGRIHEYAAGPAVVRASGRTELTARTGGTITAVEVAPGDAVTEGQPLVRFFGAQELAELERIEMEFRTMLLASLREPARPGTRQELAALRARKEQAQAQLELRTLRAPHSGTVCDIRVREGMHLQPGELVLALATASTGFSVIALLPGRFSPALRAGQPLRLELSGYRYAYLELTIRSAGSEVIGPSEVRRFLGPEIGDAVAVTGPVVLVEAVLPGPTFRADGELHEFRHAMTGTAEARVRSEPILHALVPGLRALRGDGDG